MFVQKVVQQNYRYDPFSTRFFSPVCTELTLTQPRLRADTEAKLEKCVAIILILRPFEIYDHTAITSEYINTFPRDNSIIRRSSFLRFRFRATRRRFLGNKLRINGGYTRRALSLLYRRVRVK